MEKVAEFKKNLFTPFRFAALLLVTLALAISMRNFDRTDNARMDSMTPADYVAYQHHLHSQGFTTHFIALLCTGMLYLAIVETIAFVLRRVARAK